MDALGMFDQPLYNGGSETIPGSAVVEVTAPGFREHKGRDYFNVGKPTADGKIYFINSPFPIAPGRAGSGALPYRTPGVHSLFEVAQGEAEPATGDELGPVADKWTLGKGSGFFVVGDIKGAAASQPGFPPSSSTKRVRVNMTAVALADDIILGNCYGAVLPAFPQFLVNNIILVEGKDPRTNPDDPSETLEVENTYRDAYANEKQIRARLNKTTNKWQVVKEASGGANAIHGRLQVDLKITSATAQVVVELSTSAEVAAGSVITCQNKRDLLHAEIFPTDPPRYLFMGNDKAYCRATEFDGVWHLDVVQSPVLRPV